MSASHDPLPTIDLAASRDRVTRALENAGSTPWLVGFEAIGIQELIAANGRPIAMQGASKLVERFDVTNSSETHAEGRGGIVFAGGGRGLSVVPETHVDEAIAALRRRYADETCGGQLAVAKAPLDAENPAASLRWLRLELDGAKDSADPPKVPVPTSHEERCTDCKIRKIETQYAGPEEPVPSCMLCKRVVEHGRDAADQRWTLEELETSGSIALVSADGNNLGALFGSLNDLAENAICSELVSTIFKDAHRRALPEDRRYVAPVVGGDDIRVFLPPEHLLDYVTKLVRRVEVLSQALASLQGLPASLAKALPKLGVGVGAVIAPYHFPASRLIDMAHSLEDSAKAACLDARHRSAFDFLWLRSGQELSQGLDALDIHAHRPPPLSLTPAVWDRYLARARALTKVDSTQRSLMIPHHHRPEDDAELANRYRYQVARHDAWRQWFTECEVDWRDEAALARNLPDRRLVDVADLLELPERGSEP